MQVNQVERQKSLIVWIGKEPRTEATASHAVAQGSTREILEFEIQHFKDFDLQKIPSSTVAVVYSLDLDRASEAAQFLKERSPEIFRIALVDENQIFKSFDKQLQGLFDRVHGLDVTISQLWQDSLSVAIRRSEARHLRRYYSAKLKEQEELNLNLEKSVQERTEFIQASHHEEQEKGRKERQLIRFIQDLNDLVSIDEVLDLLRTDLRKLFRAAEPFLLLKSEALQLSIYSLDQEGFHHSKIKDFQFPSKLIFHDSDFSLKMANLLARPFARSVACPIELNLSRRFTKSELIACLVIEHSINEKQGPELLEYLNERLGPISMTLDRLLLEKELNTLSYRWERAFEDFKNPIAIVDSKFQLIRTNQSKPESSVSVGIRHKAETLCYTEIFGRSAPCDSCPMIKAKQTNSGQETEMNLDSRFWRAVSYPIVEQNKSVQHFVNYYSDQTHFRELHLQLLQSEKIGAIGELAGHIAHELNNPLTGIHSLAQLLELEAGENPNLRADLQEIIKATVRSQNVIKNLLEFVKGSDQQLVNISWDELVSKTLPMLKTLTRHFKQVILLRAPKALITVEPHLLQQVIFNLVNNACQAMGDKGTLGIHSFVDGSEAVLEITDTGPGIPEKVKARIFEPFFTTKEEGKGTGLGLSLSKSIVERFGGKLSFTTSLGVGTSFQIRYRFKEQA